MISEELSLITILISATFSQEFQPYLPSFLLVSASPFSSWIWMEFVSRLPHHNFPLSYSVIIPTCFIFISAHSFLHSLAVLFTTPIYRRQLEILIRETNRTFTITAKVRWRELASIFSISFITAGNIISSSKNDTNCRVLTEVCEMIRCSKWEPLKCIELMRSSYRIFCLVHLSGSYLPALFSSVLHFISAKYRWDRSSSPVSDSILSLIIQISALVWVTICALQSYSHACWDQDLYIFIQ